MVLVSNDERRARAMFDVGQRVRFVMGDVMGTVTRTEVVDIAVGQYTGEFFWITWDNGNEDVYENGDMASRSFIES